MTDPALIVPREHPHTSAPGRDIVVAWKANREAARATAAALPWLRRARQVHVASWSDDGDEQAGELTSLAHYLRQHGIEIITHCHSGDVHDVGDQLLGLASSVGADLIVMGCYGHARAREWVLGGTSRTLLRDSPLPLLTVH